MPLMPLTLLRRHYYYAIAIIDDDADAIDAIIAIFIIRYYY
jgi:hypothetical protein